MKYRHRAAAGLLAMGLGSVGSAATLSGRVVVDHSGAPAPSAEVKVYKVGARGLSADLETGAAGRFEAVGLPEGDYRIEVSKNNHVGATMRITLVDGDSSGENLFVRLIRYAVITGQVTDRENQPATGAAVWAIPKGPRGGGWKYDFTQGRSARIGADAGYRIYNVPPGEYAVVVSYGASTSALGSSGRPATAASLGTGFLFYPDNSRPEIFTVTGGEEFRNVNFAITAGTTYTVSGKVELPEPKTRYWLGLTSVDQPAMATAITIVEDDGRFRFESIPSGSYYLFTAGPIRARSSRGAHLEGTPRFARSRVAVTGQNVEGLAVTPAPGVSASFAVGMVGRIGECAGGAELVLSGVEDWGTVLDRRIVPNASGPTTLNDLAPARYLATVSGLGQACFADSVEVDLAGGTPSGPISVVIRAAGSIRGRLVGAAEDASVVLRSGELGADSRLAFPDEQGRFVFETLRPGKYRIAAQAGGGPEARRVWQPDRMFEIDVVGGTPTEIDLPVTAGP